LELKIYRKLLTYEKTQQLIVAEIVYLPMNYTDVNQILLLVSAGYDQGSAVLTSNKNYIGRDSCFPDEGALPRLFRAA